MSGHLLLASAGDDIKIWDTGSYEVVKQFNPHSGNVSRICWSHNNHFLASASTTGDKIGVAVANAAFSCREFDIAPDQNCVAFSASGKYLLTGGRNGLLNVFDLKAKKLQRTFEGNVSPVTCVTYNSNDTYIAGGTERGEICLYSTVTTQAARPLTASSSGQAVQDLQYSYFKKALLACVTDEGSTLLWDTATRCLLHSFAGVHKSPAMGLAFSPLNNMLLMSVALDKTVVFYDVTSKSVPKVMPTDCPLTSIDIMSDGHTLAVGTTRGFIYFYDLRKASHPIRTCAAHKSSVRCLRFQKMYKADSDHATPASANGPVSSGRPRAAQQNSTSASSSPRSATSQPSPRSAGTVSAPGVFDTPVPSAAAVADAPASTVRSSGSASNLARLLDVFSPTVVTGEDGHLGYTPAAMVAEGGVPGGRPVHGHSALHSPASPIGGLVFSPAAAPLADAAADSWGQRSPVSAGRPASGGRILPLLPADERLQPSKVAASSLPPNGHVTAVVGSSSDGAVTLAQLRATIGSTEAVATGFDATVSLDRQGFRPLVPAAAVQRHSPQSPRASVGGSSSSPSASSAAAGTGPAAVTTTTAAAGRSGSPRAAGSRGSSVASAGRSPRLPQTDAAGRAALDRIAAPVSSPGAGHGGCVDGPAPAEQWHAYASPAAVESAEAASGSFFPGPSVQQFQSEFIRSVVADALEEFREDVRRDIRNLHAEMVRQLHIQETAIRQHLESYSSVPLLLEENQRLREEVARLKKTY